MTDPRVELEAALDRVALADGSDLARLTAGGPDYLDLLNRLSTGAVATLEPGQGRPTVLTTPKGRIVERLFVHHLGERGVLSVGGAGSGPRVIEHLARFTFAENTGLVETTDETFLSLLLGPRALDALDAASLDRPERFGSCPGVLDSRAVDVLGHDGLGGDGFAIVGPRADAPAAWAALAVAVERSGGVTAGRLAREARRVLLGLPATGHELTEEHNPLEAGLWDAVSFDKGCYVGQEVVARLRTYDKVSRVLVGLELPSGAELPPLGARLWDGTRPAGELTSAVGVPGRPAPVALGYVKRALLRPEMSVRVDGAPGMLARVVELPFHR